MSNQTAKELEVIVQSARRQLSEATAAWHDALIAEAAFHAGDVVEVRFCDSGPWTRALVRRVSVKYDEVKFFVSTATKKNGWHKDSRELWYTGSIRAAS